MITLDLKTQSQIIIPKMQRSWKHSNFTGIEECAHALIQAGNQFICKQFNKWEADIFIPLPILLCAVEIMASDTIQFCDTTKLLLSKVCSIFSEIILLLTRTERRHIYPSTRDNLIKQLGCIQSYLPKKEVSTYFEIECSLEAVKAIEPGKGVVTEIAKKQGTALTSGSITAIAEGTLGFITGPVTFLNKLHSEMQKSWYPPVLDIKWKLTCLAHSPIRPDFEQKIYDLGDRKKIIDKGEHFSFCLTGMCADLLEKVNIEIGSLKEPSDPNNMWLHKLSDLLFKEFKETDTHLGLRGYACLNAPQKDFWKTRYLAVQHLNTLSDQDAFRELSITTLAKRLMDEENPTVITLLNTMYDKTKYQKTWDTCLYQQGVLTGSKTSNQEKIQQIQLHIKDKIDEKNHKQLLSRPSKLQVNDGNSRDSKKIKEDLDKLDENIENLEVELEALTGRLKIINQLIAEPDPHNS